MAALTVLASALGVGVVGYHRIEGWSWIDALLNASMILAGMGPVDTVRTVNGKLFASFYALFSGVLFLAVAGILIAPVVHRLLHHFHVESDVDPQSWPDPRTRGAMREGSFTSPPE